MSVQDSSDLTPSDENEQVGGSILPVAGAIGTFLTGTHIPAPIRKNAFKAFNQLCTAAIDIPVAFLEGIAAEKRIETQARLKLLSTSGDQIAKQLNVDPAFAEAAAHKYGQRIVREQTNLNKISEAAAMQLADIEQQPTVKTGVDAANSDAEDNPSISDDWLNSFEREASEKSTEEMQLLFGKILASEISKPNSFSIKTINLIGQLDASTALLFRLLCSHTMVLKYNGLILDARVPSLSGTAGSNSLASYGLSYANLNILHEHGLITADYNSYMDYGSCVVSADMTVAPFDHQNKIWILRPQAPWPEGEKLHIHGVALSNSGTQLLPIVEVQPTATYTNNLANFFLGRNMQMIEVKPSQFMDRR